MQSSCLFFFQLKRRIFFCSSFRIRFSLIPVGILTPSLTTTVAASIDEVKASIEALKEELKEEQKERRNKEEYDSLRKLIAAHPARNTTERRIATLEDEINSLKEEQTRINEQTNTRRKQFALFFHALSQLEAELTDSTAVDSSDSTGTKKMKLSE